MSVDVIVEGNAVFQPALLRWLQAPLKQRGIKILPKSDYPNLHLSVSMLGTHMDDTPYQIVVLTLSYVQAVQLPGRPGRTALSTTWSESQYGFTPTLSLGAFLGGATQQLAGKFAAALDKALPAGTKRTVVVPTGPAVPVYDPQRRVWQYEDVPESFVPPIPNDANFRDVRMYKEKGGSLYRVQLEDLTEATVEKAARTQSSLPLRNRISEQEMIILRADITEASRDPAYAGPVENGLRVHAVLACFYRRADPVLKEADPAHYFWYKSRPSAAAAEVLRARIGRHPLLLIRRPQQACPATESDADMIRAEW